MKKVLLYLAIAAVLYYFVSKYLKKEKYMKPFLDMGFSRYFLSKFTGDELYNSWNYLKNYSMKGVPLTANADPILYAKVKALNDKYHIFSNLK